MKLSDLMSEQDLIGPVAGTVVAVPANTNGAKDMLCRISK